MKLSLDSTDNKRVLIRLDDQEFVSEVHSPREQDVFGFLLSCLEKSGFKQDDITEIEVNSGPGSFTGTRIGISLANALGFALKVKVNGQAQAVVPIYSASHSITPREELTGINPPDILKCNE